MTGPAGGALAQRDRRATATVGCVGAGQLARMTHQAAIGLDIELQVLTPDPGAPAVLAGARQVPGRPDDLDDLLALAKGCDVVTFDHEHAPAAFLSALVDAGHVVRPEPMAKRLAQDKRHARRILEQAGFAVPPFAVVDAGDGPALERFAHEHGWPVVVKAPRGGYDGRGVAVVHRADCSERLEALPASDGQWLLEAMVPIALELAVLVARRPSGWWSAYPVVETVQCEGICRELVMPARIPPEIAERATALAVAVAQGIDATGILAVEFFLTTSGELVVNELAARPHNSGHATIEASRTSQFENHLRGVLDWPLGSTTMLAPAAATVNLIGPSASVDLGRGLPAALEDPRVHVHLYGKDPEPGRKLGHVTALADEPEAALAAAHGAAAILTGR